MNLKIEKEQSKTGLEIMKVNNLYIHSKYDPLKESKMIAENNYKPHHLHVVFGIGLGYLINELVKLFRFNEPILVIDPLIYQKKIDSPKFEYKRIYIVENYNKQILSNYLSQLNSYSNKVVIINSPNYDKIFPEEFLELLNEVKSSQVREIYNVNTINRFASSWQLNNLFNMKDILDDNSLKDLGKVYNCPVVIASGGPSLTKQIPYLKQYRKKIILICAGSTINSLLKHDIEPDYIVSIDGGLANYNHFKGLEFKYAQLMYATTNHYLIRKSFAQRGFPFVPKSFQTLKDFYKNKFKLDLLEIIGGGSVAHFSLSIAKKITTGPIALIGQDLAYTNGDTHADGRRKNSTIDQVKTKILEVDSYFLDGKKVKTSDSFLTMIDTFEQMQLAEPHENSIYNCTEGGAHISLYENIPFKDFLLSYCDEEVFRYQVEKNKDDKRNSLELIIEKEIEGYYSVIDLLNEGIKITNKEIGPKFNNSTLNQLSKIDEKLKKMYQDYNLDSLLEPVVMRNEIRFLPEPHETPLKTFKRVKDYTITLYSECKDSIEGFINKIEEEMEKTYE